MRANDLNLQLKALASRTYDGQLVRVVDTTIVTMGNQFLVAICSCIVQSAHAARSFVKELKTLGKKTNSFDIADKIISDCNPSMRRKISSQLRTDLDESWNKKASIALILTESAVQEQAYYQEFRSLPKSQRIMTQPEYQLLPFKLVPHSVVYYIDNDGFIRKVANFSRSGNAVAYYEKYHELRRHGLSQGYATLPDHLLIGYVRTHVGLKFSELEETIGSKASKRKRNREKFENRRSDGDSQTKPCSHPTMDLGIIVGIDKQLDIRPLDFAVRVLCSSVSTAEERRQLAKENQKELISYVVEFLQQRKRLMNKIGDLRFYRLSSIRILRTAPEIELLFSVKNADEVYKEE